tara:strand:+ start:423 stop:662 length:240 start_codon:yes stop_codon:yes gene_type:complete
MNYLLKKLSKLDNNKFTSGKYSGKTWKEIRTKQLEYFFWLRERPNSFSSELNDFVNYCLEYLTIEIEIKEYYEHRSASP